MTKPLAKKKATPRATKSTPSKTAAAYRVALTIGDQKYEAEADTMFDALDAIKPEKVSFKGVFQVWKGEKTRSFMFYVLPLRKILRTTISKQIWAKRMETMLG